MSGTKWTGVGGYVSCSNSVSSSGITGRTSGAQLSVIAESNHLLEILDLLPAEINRGPQNGQKRLGAFRIALNRGSLSQPQQTINTRLRQDVPFD